MKQLINLTARALPLANGTVLAAARTEGSERLVETIDESDQRLIDGGFISVREVEVSSLPAAPAAEQSGEPATTGESGKASGTEARSKEKR
jgi:hypothetical protein